MGLWNVGFYSPINHLMQVLAHENFIAFIHCEACKLYTNKNVHKKSSFC